MKLKIAGLQFSYNSHPVLENVDFKIEKGEMLTIIGPNASGKTTLLKCINNILKPQKGSIFIDDKSLNNLTMREIARKIGHVPQSGTESFPTTVFDTVLMGRKPHGGWKPSDKDLEKVSKTIEKLGLEEIAMRNIGEISGGQKQKALIARAVAQNPEILLLDEPTSSLDLKHQLEVLDVVKKQTENRISVVMTMHDLNLAARYSSKILMLNDGKIFAAGGVDVLNSNNIESVFGVKVDIIERSGRPMIVPEEAIIE
ncbi:MAG: ABC transporter ATP-binding protein [Candidatus Saliniplasma sp.]